MRKQYIWAATGVAAVVVAILVALSLSGGEADAENGPVGTLSGLDAVQADLLGAPQAANVLGDPDAPVEIVEYGDLACPVCKLASEALVPELVDQFVRNGKAKLVFRPIAFISPSSERGAFGAEAAAEQDAMWSLVELLYRNQGDESTDWLTDALLEEAVVALGLDLQAWRRDVRSDAIEQRYAERAKAATEDGVEGTPTFIIRGPRGERTFVGVPETSEIGEAITAVGPA